MIEYECDGQMSIYDFMKPTYPDINDIPEEEAVRIVGEAIGMEFFYSTKFQDWRSLKKGIVLTMEYGHFTLDDNHDLFLGTGYNTRNAGGGSPCDGIEEAINWFRRVMDDYAERAV